MRNVNKLAVSLACLAMPFTTFAATTTIEGEWASSGGRVMYSGNPLYRFKVPAADEDMVEVEITLNAKLVDTYLIVRSLDSTQIWENDDDGQGNNARLTLSLNSGKEYQVFAATYEQGVSNQAFELNVSSDVDIDLLTCAQPFVDSGMTLNDSQEPLRAVCTNSDKGSVATVALTSQIESLQVPKGFKATMFNVKEAVSLYEDLPAVRNTPSGSFDPFKYPQSLQLESFDKNDFAMTIISDTQMPRVYCDNDEGSVGCELEKAIASEWGVDRFTLDFSSADKKEMSIIYNRRGRRWIEFIAHHFSSQMGGIIINGDLTEVGTEEELKFFEGIWNNGESLYHDPEEDFAVSRLPVNLYPGLGNHDYDEHYNSFRCNEDCYRRMISYLLEKHGMLQLPHENIDFNFQIPFGGSYSYSFDIGDIHFVQLNNHMRYFKSHEGEYVGLDAVFKTYPSHPSYLSGYETAFDDTTTPGPASTSEIINYLLWNPEYRDQSPPTSWLEQDLKRAADNGKTIVLNVHNDVEFGKFNRKAYEDSGEYSEVEIRHREEFYHHIRRILGDYPVSAVFAGHWHESLGINKKAQNLPPSDSQSEPSREVPVFRSGALFKGGILIPRFIGDKMYVFTLQLQQWQELDHYPGNRTQEAFDDFTLNKHILNYTYSPCEGTVGCSAATGYTLQGPFQRYDPTQLEALFEICEDGDSECDSSRYIEVTLRFKDSDDDGVKDTEDNCMYVPNPAQYDSDYDGFGNLCDVDLDNDGIVGVGDLNVMRSQFFRTDPDGKKVGDLNGDGVINFSDLAILRKAYNSDFPEEGNRPSLSDWQPKNLN